METDWLLLRHAPTRGPSGRFAGRSDREIAPVDLDLVAAACLAIGRAATVVLTPLQRTRQTLDLLLRAGLPTPRDVLVEQDLIEQDFGRWEECDYDLLAATDPAYWPFWDDPVACRPPDGESYRQVHARATAAYRRLHARLAGPVLHVGHAGPIRALLGFRSDVGPAAALARAVPPLSLHRMQDR